MKIGFLCNHAMAHPALALLAREKALAGVAVPNANVEANAAVVAIAKDLGVPSAVAPREVAAEALGRWLDAARPDAVFVITFPYRLPAVLLERPPLGFFNFHPGRLPQERGPDPILWAVRTRATSATMTVHRMVHDLDAGPIAFAESTPLDPLDTYGVVTRRLSEVAASCAVRLLRALDQHGKRLPLAPQNAAASANRGRATARDLVVDWAALDAVEIDALVRATNPVLGGAVTALGAADLRLVQVTRLRDPAPRGTAAGTLVHADADRGLTVATRDGALLRVDVLYTPEGLFDGARFARNSLRRGSGRAPHSAHTKNRHVSQSACWPVTRTPARDPHAGP